MPKNSLKNLGRVDVAGESVQVLLYPTHPALSVLELVEAAIATYTPEDQRDPILVALRGVAEKLRIRQEPPPTSFKVGDRVTLPGQDYPGEITGLLERGVQICWFKWGFVPAPQRTSTNIVHGLAFRGPDGIFYESGKPLCKG